MLLSKSRQLIVVMACLLSSVSLHAQDSGCPLVMHPNGIWGFTFTAPKSWRVSCAVKPPLALILVPEGSKSLNEAPGLIYVTVSEPHGFSLEEFAKDELLRFRQKSPGLQVETVAPITIKNNAQALVRKLTGDQYGNHELIAYVEASEDFYLMVVLSSRTQKEFDPLSPAFAEFVSSIAPIDIKFVDSDKASAPSPQGP